MKFKQSCSPTPKRAPWIGLRYRPRQRCYNDDNVQSALLGADPRFLSRVDFGECFVHRIVTIGLWRWEWQVTIITKAKPRLKKPVAAGTV